MTTKALLQSLGYPSELRSLFQYKFGTEDKTMYPTMETLPDPTDPHYSYALCYYFLNQTSRSFARVIQELHPELRHPVCLFYLILRGLDTIEDDMTLDLDMKLKLLRSFDQIIYKRGWTFDGNGEDEKDRILLVRFDVVIEEFLKLKKEYVPCCLFYFSSETIADITKRMGHGMAEFCEGKKVETIDDYNLYTHYVAGLVGLGLTGLFVDSKLEPQELGKCQDLANRMGLFLQRINILKDYLTDVKEGRLYWPKEIWSLYVNPGDDVSVLAQPENLSRALACLNHLCADALELVPDTLEYLSRLEEPSVFRFAAIPQLMAIATLVEFFNNPLLFQKPGNKIRRGLAVKLILSAQDMESLKSIYFDYALQLNEKNRLGLGRNPHDKSFLRISSGCSNIVRWIHEHDAKQGRKVARRMPSSFGFTSSTMMWLVVFIAVAWMASLPGVV